MCLVIKTAVAEESIWNARLDNCRDLLLQVLHDVALLAFLGKQELARLPNFSFQPVREISRSLFDHSSEAGEIARRMPVRGPAPFIRMLTGVLGKSRADKSLRKFRVLMWRFFKNPFVKSQGMTGLAVPFEIDRLHISPLSIDSMARLAFELNRTFGSGQVRPQVHLVIELNLRRIFHLVANETEFRVITLEAGDGPGVTLRRPRQEFRQIRTGCSNECLVHLEGTVALQAVLVLHKNQVSRASLMFLVTTAAGGLASRMSGKDLIAVMKRAGMAALAGPIGNGVKKAVLLGSGMAKGAVFLNKGVGA